MAISTSVWWHLVWFWGWKLTMEIPKITIRIHPSSGLFDAPAEITSNVTKNRQFCHNYCVCHIASDLPVRYDIISLVMMIMRQRITCEYPRKINKGAQASITERPLQKLAIFGDIWCDFPRRQKKIRRWADSFPVAMRTLAISIVGFWPQFRATPSATRRKPPFCNGRFRNGRWDTP